MFGRKMGACILQSPHVSAIYQPQLTCICTTTRLIRPAKIPTSGIPFSTFMTSHGRQYEMPLTLYKDREPSSNGNVNKLWLTADWSYNIYMVPKTLSVQTPERTWPLPIVLPSTTLIVKVQMKHAMKHDFCNVHVRELNSSRNKYCEVAFAS